jgi:hypothetical protein
MVIYIQGAGDSVVGIATRYALSGPGIAYRSDEILLTPPSLSPRVRGLSPGGKVVWAWL